MSPSGTTGRPLDKGPNSLASQLASVLAAINRVPSARTALKTLLGAGCDERAILLHLYLYRGGTAEEQAGTLMTEQKFRDSLVPIAEQLQEAAGYVERLILVLKERGFEMQGFDEVPAQVREFAGLILVYRKGYVAEIKKKGLRNEELAYLFYLIYEKTDDPHHRDIAALVSAIQGTAKDSNLILLEDKTRNTIKRFIKAHPSFAEELKAMAVDEVAEWTNAS